MRKLAPQMPFDGLEQRLKLCRSKKSKEKRKKDMDDKRKWFETERLWENATKQADSTIRQLHRVAETQTKQQLKPIVSKSEHKQTVLEEELLKHHWRCWQSIDRPTILAVEGDLQKEYMKKELRLNKEQEILGVERLSQAKEKMHKKLSILNSQIVEKSETFCEKLFGLAAKSRAKLREAKRNAVHFYAIVTIPKFNAVFAQWCYYKRVEYFLNQIAPMSWRLKHDFILALEYEKYGEKLETSLDISNLDSAPPLYFMRYRTLKEKNTNIIQNYISDYETFKLDIEQHIGFKVRNYFDTIYKLKHRLWEIRKHHRTKNMPIFLIGKKNRDKNVISDSERQVETFVQKSLAHKQDKLRQIEQRIKNLKSDRDHRFDFLLSVKKPEDVEGLLVYSLSKKERKALRELCDECFEYQFHEISFNDYELTQIIIKKILAMAYFFDIQRSEDDTPLKQKRKEGRQNKERERSFHLCKWIVERKPEIEQKRIIRDIFEPPFVKHGKPTMFRSMPKKTKPRREKPFVSAYERLSEEQKEYLRHWTSYRKDIDDPKPFLKNFFGNNKKSDKRKSVKKKQC